MEIRESYASPVEKGINYTENDFKRVKSLIHQKTGIWLGDNKQEMVYSRLNRIIREENLLSVNDYLDKLTRQQDKAIWQDFINALTTNLTAFFREKHHFVKLKEFLANTKNEPVRIWCSASSTGEEPYSIAMTVRDVLGPNARCKILASDIDTQALAHAERGVYPESAINNVPEDLAKIAFQRGGGQNQGMVRIKPEIRNMITFSRINLIDALPTNGTYDVIFCRNVMIYFNKETQQKILDHFCKVMKPNGLLFAGHSENFSFMTNKLTLQGSSVYKINNKG